MGLAALLVAGAAGALIASIVQARPPGGYHGPSGPAPSMPTTDAPRSAVAAPPAPTPQSVQVVLREGPRPR